jgi:hypothetical protein
MQQTRRRFGEVLYMLEQERKRFDEDLRRLTIAAAYLRALLPPQAPHEKKATLYSSS